MISKIIQKEKERQDYLLPGCGNINAIEQTINCGSMWKCKFCGDGIRVHKQSLINLKEYMRDEYNYLVSLQYDSQTHKDLVDDSLKKEFRKDVLLPMIDKRKQLLEDIKELNKMIERYE